jgi:outer membrane protein
MTAAVRAPGRSRATQAARRLAAALALAAAALPCAARTDLIGVLELAEQMDPLYREAQASALAVAEQVPQARAALWLPSLSLSAGAARVKQDITTDSGFGTGGEISYSAYDYRINLSQPVYHRDRFIELEQADKRVQQAQLEVLAARQELMLRVAERYFNQLAADDNLEFALAEEESLRSQLEQARERFEVGLIPITDVQEAQAGYDRAHADQISARNAVDNAQEALRELTESYHEDLLPLGPGMPLAVPEPMDIEAWTTTALQNNLSLQAARLAAAIAHEEIRRQYAQHFPTLDIVSGQGFNRQGGRFGGTELAQGDIGIQLNVPIYEGGRTVSRTRAAEHEHTAAVERLEQTRRAVHRETREAYLGIVARISAVRALEQAVLSSETALEATRAGFEVGTRTAVDVVAAERLLFQARRDYARARYDYIIDTLRLKRAAGSLVPDDLVIANSWLAAGGEPAPTAP